MVCLICPTCGIIPRRKGATHYLPTSKSTLPRWKQPSHIKNYPPMSKTTPPCHKGVTSLLCHYWVTSNTPPHDTKHGFLFHNLFHDTHSPPSINSAPSSKSESSSSSEKETAGFMTAPVPSKWFWAAPSSAAMASFFSSTLRSSKDCLFVVQTSWLHAWVRELKKKTKKKKKKKKIEESYGKRSTTNINISINKQNKEIKN